MPLQANAYDYNYGPASNLYSTDWLMHDNDLDQVEYAFPQIYNLFLQQNVYGQLQNYKSQTTGTLVRNQIYDMDTNHDWSTVFYYGHYNTRSVGLAWPDYSYGFSEQAPQAQQSPAPSTIWDSTDVYVSHAATSNHKFVFLWVCNNGNNAGSTNPVRGMPFAWTKQPSLNPNGYDAREYCVISFYNFSVTLMEGMGTFGDYGLGGTENIYKFWLVWFYYFALNGYSIHGALDQASIICGWSGGWSDPANRLSQGYNYYYHITQDYFFGQMCVYGNSYIYLPQD